MEVGSSSLPGTTLDNVYYKEFLFLHLFGGLAQLARAPALQAGGQRFESVILHFCKTFYNVCIEFFDILTQARL